RHAHTRCVPCLRQASDRGEVPGNPAGKLAEPILDDLTAPNNEIQTVALATEHGNVLERIPIDQHEVGECSGGYDTEFTGLAHQLGIRDRCRPQDVEGRLNFSL